MALKDLKTNLKSLQYPTERENGAPSFQRVVSFPDDIGGDPVFRTGEVRLGLDNLQGISYSNNVVDGTFRGGFKTFNERLKEDTIRLRSYLSLDAGLNFAETYKGEEFNKRQLGLQLMNPKISAPMGGLIDTSPANQRTYNPVNLATQVSISGTGIHIKREGAQPFNERGYINATRFGPSFAQDPTGDLIGSGLNALGLVGNLDSDSKDNRMIYLFDEKIGLNGTRRDLFSDAGGGTGETTSLGNFLDGINNIAGAIGNVANTVLNKIGGRGEELYSYSGGPGSAFGIGRTFIGRYTYTTIDKQGNNFPTVTGHTVGSTGQSDIKNYLLTLGRPNATTYGTNRREDKYKLGNPGSKNGSEKYIMAYNASTNDAKIKSAIDALNQQDIVSSTTDNIPEDYVKFRFEAVDTLDPTSGDIIAFRAFLNDISDSFGASFNEYKYNGRAEAFYTYNSFKRDIGLSFTIAAQTRHEMKPLYRKLNYLASTTAPEYSDIGRIRTPFMKLTVGDWFNKLPGVISAVNLKWNTNYPWEVKSDNEKDTDMLVLPHVLEVSISFLPIHTFLPKKSIEDSPFLAINDWLGASDNGTNGTNGTNGNGNGDNDSVVLSGDTGLEGNTVG